MLEPRLSTATDDWGQPSDNWQQGKRQEPTFKQDFGGFMFHLAMIALIGSTVAYAWDAFAPKPTIRIQLERLN